MSSDPDEILKTCPKCHQQDRTSFSTCRYCSYPYEPHVQRDTSPTIIEKVYNAPFQAVAIVFIIVSLLCYLYVSQTLGASSNKPPSMIWGGRGEVPAIPAAFIAFFGGKILGKASQTIEQSTEILRENPKDYAALVSRGDSYWTQGAMSQAFTDYSSAINANPDIPEAYEKRAVIYDAMGEYDKAKKDQATAESLKKH